MIGWIFNLNTYFDEVYKVNCGDIKLIKMSVKPLDLPLFFKIKPLTSNIIVSWQINMLKTQNIAGLYTGKYNVIQICQSFY